MPRLLNNRTVLEYDDGTRVDVPPGVDTLRCPKCGAHVPIREKSHGCLITWFVILLVIILVWVILEFGR